MSLGIELVDKMTGTIIALPFPNSDSVQFVYGRCYDMTKEEFINKLITYQESLKIILPKNHNEINVSRKTLIYTEKTIPGDVLIPLEGLGVVIEDYWVYEVK